MNQILVTCLIVFVGFLNTRSKHIILRAILVLCKKNVWEICFHQSLWNRTDAVKAYDPQNIVLHQDFQTDMLISLKGSHALFKYYI